MAKLAMLLENNPYPQDVRVRSEAESLARAGHEVTVIAPRAEGQPRRERVAGVWVRRFDLPDAGGSKLGFVGEYLIANFWLYVGGIVELLRGAEVVHFHNPPDTLFGVGFLARLLGREVVFDHHDLAPELFEAKFGSGSVVTALRQCERLTFRSSTLVLAANESHRDVAIERGGVAPERVAIVRNGPPPAAYAEVSDGRDGQLEDPRLLFLGSMESQDGVDSLPALLERLTEDHGLGGATLTCVGEGSRRAPLEATFAAAGLGERVRFTGRVPHAEVPALLAEADICLDPAPCTPLNERSTMIKIAEYMAARRPVVAFPLLETRRTAGDAVAFAERDDLDSFAAQIARLAAAPERRAELTQRGAERATTLSWEESEKVLLGAYADLTNERRSPSNGFSAAL
jgi:glycosyltransferase involved in cell wall biosynthesis